MNDFKADWIYRTFAVVALIVGLVCLFPGRDELFNFISLAAIPWLYITAFAALAFMAMRRKFAAGLCLATAIALGANMADVVNPMRTPKPAQARVRILFANMYAANRTPEKLLPFIKAQSPDVIVMVESSPQERARLTPALKAYPYQFFYGETHIFSRYAFTDRGYRPYGHTLQSIALTGTPAGPLDLEIVHLSRPWPFDNPKDARVYQPREVSDIVARLRVQPTNRTVMVGDFNATPNSPLPRGLARQLDLRLAAAPTGTWPSFLPGALRLNLDNVLYGKALTLNHRQVGPGFGSDHRPVVFDVSNR